MTNGFEKRPGFSAVWGVFDGLAYFKRHFKFPFPTDEVRNALPQRDRRTGASAILDGALPLPPEALDLLCVYTAREDTPPVLGIYAYALVISTLGSMRQMNAQHIYYYANSPLVQISFCWYNTPTANPVVNSLPSPLYLFKICETVVLGSTETKARCGKTLTSLGLNLTATLAPTSHVSCLVLSRPARFKGPYD